MLHPDFKPMLIERRELKNRRLKPTRPISRYTFVGRRKEARRVEELDNYYVDKYELHLLIVVSLIMIFCVLDTLFTLKINHLGGSEGNLLMLIFMEKNLALSLLVKFLITAGCSIFLLIHKNFKIFGAIKTYLFIYFIFFVYFILTLYEIYSLVLINGI